MSTPSHSRSQLLYSKSIVPSVVFGARKKRKTTMKRLMMAVAIVLAAVSANAATTSWKWTTGTTVLKAGYTGSGASSEVLSGITVYLLATDATSTSDFSAQTALLASIRNGTTTAATLGELASAQTDSAGKITTPTAFNRTDVTVGSAAYYYEVAFSSDGDYVFLSANAKTTALDEGKQATITTGSGPSTQLRDAEGTAAFSAAGWYAVGVPEPTSGLMLLLGVAGLALKRKRA